MANWHQSYFFNDYPINTSFATCMCSLDLVKDNAWLDAYWRGLMSLQVWINEGIIEPTLAIKIHEVPFNWKEFKEA